MAGLPMRRKLAAGRSGVPIGMSSIKALSMLSSARCERCCEYVINDPLAVGFDRTLDASKRIELVRLTDLALRQK